MVVEFFGFAGLAGNFTQLPRASSGGPKRPTWGKRLNRKIRIITWFSGVVTIPMVDMLKHQLQRHSKRSEHTRVKEKANALIAKAIKYYCHSPSQLEHLAPTHQPFLGVMRLSPQDLIQQD